MCDNEKWKRENDMLIRAFTSGGLRFGDENGERTQALIDELARRNAILITLEESGI